MNRPAERLPGGICVATDHEEILRAVHAFGGRAEMTDPRAASGTDRVAEVARRMPDAEIIVNVQGDEPEIAGSSIDLAVEMLQSIRRRSCPPSPRRSAAAGNWKTRPA